MVLYYEHALHKGDFCNALCLHYGWQPQLLLSICVYGHYFTVKRAKNCPCVDFPQFITMSYMQNITASLCTHQFKVCNVVGTEPYSTDGVNDLPSETYLTITLLTSPHVPLVCTLLLFSSPHSFFKSVCFVHVHICTLKCRVYICMCPTSL